MLCRHCGQDHIIDEKDEGVLSQEMKEKLPKEMQRVLHRIGLEKFVVIGIDKDGDIHYSVSEGTNKMEDLGMALTLFEKFKRKLDGGILGMLE